MTKTYYSIIGLPYFIRDFFILLKTRKRKDDMNVKFFPILSERFEDSGTVKGHYFHQDIWAAKKIHLSAPSSHLDVGSRIDGFIAHLLVFMNVTVLDIRELKSNVKGLTFRVFNPSTIVTEVQKHSLVLLSFSMVDDFGHFTEGVEPSSASEFNYGCGLYEFQKDS